MEAMFSPWRDVDMCKLVNSLDFPIFCVSAISSRVIWFVVQAKNSPHPA